MDSFTDIYFDVTTLLNVPLRDGIRRVTRVWLEGLTDLDPYRNQVRVHPVKFVGNECLYSFELFMKSSSSGFGYPLHGSPTVPKVDSKMLIPAYDSFISDRNLDFSQIMGRAEITSVIYDLLPILNPEWFPPEVAEKYRFADTIYKQLFYSNKIIVNSTQVKMDVLNFASNRRIELAENRVKVIPLPSFNIFQEDHHEKLSKSMSDSGVSFLMVGTIEPRKGHIEVLDAFIEARERNLDVDLKIVGRRGWGVDEVISKLQFCEGKYPRNFTWLSDTTDEELVDHYAMSDAVIVASKGEGFGLPVVESLAKGKATFIRGIPVLEEVSKGHAVSFGVGKTYDSLLAIFLDGIGAIKLASHKAKGFKPNLLSENLTEILDFLKL